MVLSFSQEPQADAREIAEQFTFIPIEEPDSLDWLDAVLGLRDDYPADPYEIIIGCVIAVNLVLILPSLYSERVIRMLFDALLGNIADDNPWLFDSYIPAIIEASKNINVSFYARLLLFNRFIGTLIKLFWGQIFQEEIFKLSEEFYQNWLPFGARMSPWVNAFASNLEIPYIFILFASFANWIWDKFGTRLAVIPDYNMYPGAEECNKRSPHALWH